MKAAKKEEEATGKKTGPRQTHARRWWRFWRGRSELMGKLAYLKRYIACSVVTKRPVFEFINSQIHPNARLQVFTFEDDYSFGILQSFIHWEWFTAHFATLKGDWAYTSDTVFVSFPWPQSSSEIQIGRVARAAVSLRNLRRHFMQQNKWSFRELYRTLEVPGKNPLRDAHDALDAAVREAYGMTAEDDILGFLLKLNKEVAIREAEGLPVVGPGLPPFVTDKTAYVTDDCVRMEQ